jgi:hypothetical protein
MRRHTWAALLLAVAAGTGCAARTQPYRFSMPMLGQADVPPAELGKARPEADTRVARREVPSNRADRTSPPRQTYAYGWQRDAQSGIRTVSAAGIELKQPEASDATAQAVVASGLAHAIETAGLSSSGLRAPHRTGSAADAATRPLEVARTLREPSDLRTRVGVRDKRDAYEVVLGWIAELGMTFRDPGMPADELTAAVVTPTDIPALVAWASTRGKLLAATEAARPGDLLVFDRAVANKESDLVAIVIGRDARGVTEFVYVGRGVIRRGFVDAARPAVRRDYTGAVVNTFLRHGTQWPPKGTRYLAGELLSHVIRLR